MLYQEEEHQEEEEEEHDFGGGGDSVVSRNLFVNFCLLSILILGSVVNAISS